MSLVRRIREALDPLRARLRRAELAAVVQRLRASGVKRRARGAPLAVALLDQADAAAGERADRAALLEGDVPEELVERARRAIGRLDGQRELCLVAAGRLFAGDPPAKKPEPLAPEARLVTRLVEHALDRAAPWTVRAAALDAAREALAVQPWPSPEALLTRLEALACATRDPRWVQVAALRALGAVDRRRARSVARARVLDPRTDVVVRARAARILTGELGDPEASAALMAAALDDSEHLRQSVARACETCGEPSTARLLVRLADPAREASPRVRAVVALAHAARAGGSAGPLERIPSARALARALLYDPDPLVVTVAADAAAQRSAADDPDSREILGTALSTARGRADLTPAASHAVARAAERVVILGAAYARLHEGLASAAAQLDEGQAARLHIGPDVSDDTIGRVLAELAQRDFGLYADRRGEALLLRRGDRLRWRAWRVLHELSTPSPTKRQGHAHTVGRAAGGALRAHPAGLAEVAPTRVPGERVHVGGEGGWGAYLPLVDDLLPLEPARLYSEHGCTAITPPRGAGARLAARVALSRRYAELADLRLASLASSEAPARSAYARAIAELGFDVRFEPHDVAPARLRALFAVAPVPLVELWHSLGNLDPGSGGLTELALFAGAASLVLAGRSLATRIDIASCRRAIPLVIGGWGTRGKSGVERLKAALFHSLGYEVVSKTTGCEATLLIGVPGAPLVETPLYRPYEKATIWEQRDVLRFAGTRRPHVLLWECMALSPPYVDLLQRGWMRDDLSTITNAYPDHEDVQGPSGVDVARAIARFTPSRATLVTAEDQMLPVIAEQARHARTRLLTVAPWAHELLPEDLMARFPYQEHPRNVALVMSLAEELGIDPEVALLEMADHVVADVGGLKVYGPLEVAGRQVRFANVMSANERTSAMQSWCRLGLDRHRVEDEPDRWIVALVNNRADRESRTAVFAGALVDEIAAHRIVLVGSNTGGLRRAIEEALDHRLARGDAGSLREQMKLAPGEEVAPADLRRRFMERVVEPPDPLGSADEILDFVAGICPPGARIDLVGLMNIKGPGLALVHRFAGTVEPQPAPPANGLARMLGRARRALDHLSSSSRRRRADRILRQLADGTISARRAARELAAVCDEQRTQT